MNLHLEPVAAYHIEAVQVLASQPEVQRTTQLPEPYPADGARVFIQESMLLRDQGLRQVFAIVVEGELAGLCGFHDICQGFAQLGYWLGKQWWGKGHASEAVRQLVQQGFVEFNLELVYSQCLLTNRASIRVLEKTGLHLTEVKKLPNSKWSDVPIAFFQLGREMYLAGQTK